MTRVQVPADVFSVDPPWFAGQQGVSATGANSATITVNMVPDTDTPNFPPQQTPTLYGTAMDSSGGTAYLVSVAVANGATASTNSVPVTITIANNPPTSPLPLPSLTITIMLEYSGNDGEDSGPLLV